MRASTIKDESCRLCKQIALPASSVEQEMNGLYTYNRKPKVDPDAIRSINTRLAAIEAIK